VDRLLHVAARTVLSIEVATPEAWREALPALFGRSAATAGCVWVHCVGTDVGSGGGVDDGGRSGAGDGAADHPVTWRNAVEQLFLRVNERRDALLRHIPGGLVFAVHPAMKPLIRNAAPDLWSMRSLVLDTTPAPAEPSGAERAARERVDREPRATPGTAETGEYLGTRLSEAGATGELGRRLRRVDRLLRDEEPDAAVESGLLALDALPPGAPAVDRLAALCWLSRAEESADDGAAAADHAAAALGVIATDPALAERELQRELLGRLARLAERRGAAADARPHRAALVDLARAALAGDPRDVASRRQLSAALDAKGDLDAQLGDLPAAAAAYAEALELDRALSAEGGPDAEPLRDVSVSLNKVGDVHREQGDLTTALDAYTESLTLRRRLLTAYGDTPTTLRDLSVSLDRVARTRDALGDGDAAAVAYEEALAIDRRRRELFGDQQRIIEDLVWSLERVAELRARCGDAVGARAATEEADLLRGDRRVDQDADRPAPPRRWWRRLRRTHSG
jgi:tetratricopeptide (TPR) repeat protein